MQTKVGDIFKSFLNGSEYIVKKIANKMAMLESKNGESHILTGIENLGIKTFYTNPINQLRRHKKQKNKLIEDFISVLLLTITNPFAIFLFVAMFAALNISYEADHLLLSFVPMVGVLLGGSLWWFTLSSLVNMFRTRFRLKQLWWINKIAGAVIFLLGVLALINVIRVFYFKQ